MILECMNYFGRRWWDCSIYLCFTDFLYLTQFVRLGDIIFVWLIDIDLIVLYSLARMRCFISESDKEQKEIGGRS